MAYRGITAPIPIGILGFSGSKNPSQLQPGHLSFVDGMQLEAGVLQKEGGATKLNATAIGSGSKILAGKSVIHPNGNVHELVFLSNGTVMHDNGSGNFAVTVRSGLTSVEEPPPVFVNAGGEDVGAQPKTFLFSSANQVQVLALNNHATDGMVDISTPPSDWNNFFPTFGAHHDNRLWAGGNESDPHRIYYSTILDHQDFVGAGSGTLPVFPGEGRALVGGLSFRGMLLLWKYPIGVYFVDTRQISPSDWVVRRLSTAVGGLNQLSIVPIENDIMYMDHGGNIHLLSATSEFGDVNTSNLSQLADLGPFMRSDVNLSRIRRACGIWYAAKRQAWYSVPGFGQDNNTIRIMVDFNAPDIGPRFLPSRRDVSTAVWMRQGSDGVSRPMAGDDVGFVWSLDQEDRNKDGQAYALRFETANIDFSYIDQALGPKSKNGQFLEVVAESAGDWDLTVDVFWDDVYTQTILFNMGAGGAPLDSFELDTDTLGSTAVFSNRRRMIGSGRRLRFNVENDGLNQDVAISSFHVGFSISDERTRNVT